MVNPVSGDALTALVEQIVDGLFTNGFGEKADRLVLTQDGRGSLANLGGWSREAVSQRIIAALIAAAVAEEG
jgi:hypothetical protein